MYFDSYIIVLYYFIFILNKIFVDCVFVIVVMKFGNMYLVDVWNVCIMLI